MFVLARQPDFGFVDRAAVPAEWKGASANPEQQWKVIDTLFGRTRYASGELGGRGGGPTLVCAPGIFDRVPIDTWPSCRPDARDPYVPVFLLRTRHLELGEEFSGRAGSRALLILSLGGPDSNPKAQGSAVEGGNLLGKHVQEPALHDEVPVWPLIQDVHVCVVEDDPTAVWVILLPLVPSSIAINKRLATPVLHEVPRPWTPFAELHHHDQLRLHEAMRDEIPEYGPRA